MCFWKRWVSNGSSETSKEGKTIDFKKPREMVWDVVITEAEEGCRRALEQSCGL